MTPNLWTLGLQLWLKETLHLMEVSIELQNAEISLVSLLEKDFTTDDFKNSLDIHKKQLQGSSFLI